ncbi:RxLR-like protein [Phytophthora cinnamomi]|uniref:RxLR-like protein n=1 Tax=Phytophthora cinnamomi TaxID=4785 RepID=UPI00355950DF|nr:RxLR-like protein [Phytophthora cinnamomi]
MDKVALQCAKGFTRNRNMTTESMNRISFKLPIHIDDIVTMLARVCSVREFNLEVEVEVFISHVRTCWPGNLAMLLVLLVASLLFLASPAPASPSLHASPVVELRPESPLSSQRVRYGEPQLYRVLDLQPDKVYDIKVSYPATQPSLFSLQVEQVLLPLPVAGEDKFDVSTENVAVNIMKSKTMPTRRRVLNTAKLRLHPKEMETHESVRYRLEPSGAAVEVEFSLTAQVEGVRRPDSKLKFDECVFDIVVEEMLLEAFPRDTLVLIGWLVVLLALSAKWVLPYLENKIALGCVEDRVKGAETKES